MSKPIYNSDGVNINYDAKVTIKTDGRYYFRLQNDGIKFFNEKVYGKFSETACVVDCYINTKEYADEIIQHLRDNNCEVDVWVDLTEDFVNNWNAQYDN
jgi:hypothetical protein